jgi:hypothetical protein
MREQVRENKIRNVVRHKPMNGRDIGCVTDEQFVGAECPNVARSCDGSLWYFGDCVLIG